MNTRDVFDRYARLRNAVAEAYSRESCDERRFADLVMQLGAVEAQIAPLQALAMRAGDKGTVWAAPSAASGVSNASPQPSRVDAVLRGASSMLSALTEFSAHLRRRPEVGPGLRRRFHWFARGTGGMPIELPVVRLLP